VEELRAVVHRLVSDRLAESSQLPVVPAVSVAPAVHVAPAASVRGKFEPGFRLILVNRDGSDGTTYSLDADQVDIGRTEGDLRFDDPYLSARHARIVFTPDGHVLSALEKRNGVYQRLRASVELSDGDQILVGRQVLKFETVPELEKGLQPAIQQGVVLFGTPVRDSWGRLRQITQAGVTRDLYHLGRSEMVLGREQGDIVFPEDEFISRRHAQLSFRDGVGRIEDLGSSNGTFLRLRGPHTLASGDLIRVGDELLRFEA
jgi:pSer/pThr/pTyr-binding forkhead associated (FHA) protein